MSSASISKPRGGYHPYARWRMLPLEAVSLTGGFWARRQDTNRRVSLLHAYQMLEQAGNFHNFRLAAGLAEGQYRGRLFLDSDVYKWLEAVSYELHNYPDAELEKLADEAIDLISAAQQSDGYLNSYYQVVKPDGRWSDLDFGHELYCAGHLFQAAVAHYRATHTTKLLDVATRLADLLCATFGPDKRPGAPGHPEMDVELDETAPLQATWREALLPEGVMVVQTTGCIVEDDGWQGQVYRPLGHSHNLSRQAVSLTAIPYYAWANRGANAMRVWIPRARAA